MRGPTRVMHARVRVRALFPLWARQTSLFLLGLFPFCIFFYRSLSHLSTPLPSFLLSSPRPATPPRSSSPSEPLTGMQKLCSSLRAGPALSDSRPTSPFRHHFMPHNKGKSPAHLPRPLARSPRLPKSTSQRAPLPRVQAHHTATPAPNTLRRTNEKPGLKDVIGTSPLVAKVGLPSGWISPLSTSLNTQVYACAYACVFFTCVGWLASHKLVLRAWVA